jgi:hypothetical protein
MVAIGWVAQGDDPTGVGDDHWGQSWARS